MRLSALKAATFPSNLSGFTAPARRLPKTWWSSASCAEAVSLAHVAPASADCVVRAWNAIPITLQSNALRYASIFLKSCPSHLTLHHQVSFSPGSLIAGGLVAHSKPLEPGRKSNDNSFPTSNHNLTGSPGNSQPTGTNPFPVPDLDNWLFAAPWNHIQGSKHVLPRSETFRAGNTVHHRPSVPAFPIYQDSIAASECETTGLRPLPSDSGYESLGRTQHSIVNGSIFGDCDRTGETASVVSGLLDRSFDRSTIPLLDWTRSGAPQSTRVGPRVEGSGLICPFCRESVKTKSELK